MGNKFMELLANSTIFQGAITLIVIGTWSYLLISGKPVPQQLDPIVGAVVGFFFGGKFVQATARSKSE